MTNKDFFAALEDLEAEKGIKKEFFIESLEAGLVAAYKKNFGTAKAIEAKLNPDKNTIQIIAFKTVVEEVVDPDKEISLENAKLTKANAKVGDILKEEVTPKDFGRIAAGTAKQVIMQKLREYERGLAFGELQDKVGTLINASVRRVEGDNVYFEIAGSTIEGIMGPNDQVKGENYAVGKKFKVYVKKLKEGLHGVQALITRANTEFVRKLFEIEVPEIVSGVVEIKNIVREPGVRTKLSIESHNNDVDALGACVGNRGARVNAVVSEMGGEESGEKIDIIIYSEDPFEYIARALNPAKVISVEIDEILKSSKVVVPDDKLSLAIGKGGQNVRLAARLTGWKIDVKSESASKEQDEQLEKASKVSTDVDDVGDLFVDLDE